MENTITWLLIADASKARLYAMHKARFLQDQNPNNLHLIAQYTHDQSRQKSSDLVADRMGLYGKGTFEKSISPKIQEAEEFALELLKFIEAARQDKNFRDLIIVAPPSFMGLIHKHMPNEMLKVVSQKIEKNYTQHEGRKLTQSLIIHF